MVKDAEHVLPLTVEAAKNVRRKLTNLNSQIFQDCEVCVGRKGRIPAKQILCNGSEEMDWVFTDFFLQIHNSATASALGRSCRESLHVFQKPPGCPTILDPSTCTSRSGQFHFWSCPCDSHRGKSLSSVLHKVSVLQ
jgi:hypothetical protein